MRRISPLVQHSRHVGVANVARERNKTRFLSADRNTDELHCTITYILIKETHVGFFHGIFHHVLLDEIFK